MIRREPDRPAKPLRELSARLLEDQLVRLARASVVIERRLGPGLRIMSGQRPYRQLGFVRLGDYLTERLGMSLRRCQTITRCERALMKLPVLAAAFDAGELPPSKLRAIVGVASEETQELWLARARRCSVSDLVAAARVARQEDSSPASDSESELKSPDNQITAGARASADDEGVQITFRAPARAVALWHWALDLVRRAAGHQEPAWRCVEYLAAEFLSGVSLESTSPRAGDIAAPASPFDKLNDAIDGKRRYPSTREQFSEDSETGAGTLPDALTWSVATAAARDAFRPLGRAADPDLILARQSLTESFDATPSDPWDLDGRLRGLIRLRQSLAWRLGRLLTVVSSHRLHEELGAASFSEWCEVALGMSPRRARYLISLDRRIKRLPQIADAYRRGLISWCQARHLVRIAAPETERRWIRYARQVTVRRLEETIAQAEIAAAGSQFIAPAPGPGSDAQGSHAPEPANDSTHRALLESHRHMCAPSLPFDEPSPGDIDERPTHRIRFWLPSDVVDLWHEALSACRRSKSRHLDDWQCLIVMIDSLRRTWESPTDRGWRRRYRIFERDGWQCRVPGCTSRANLNEHHIVFRSRGGGDQDDNLVTLCLDHHQRGIHDSRVRCIGEAPDDLYWELGVRCAGPPLLCCRGDRIIRGGRLPARAGRPKEGAAPIDSGSASSRLARGVPAGEGAPRARVL